MSITITLDNELADKLARQAEDHHASLQEWAVRVLEDVVENGHDVTAWTRLNARRLALISKEHTDGLTDSERTELADLQDAVAKACEPQDRELLERLEAYEVSARRSTADQNE